MERRVGSALALACLLAAGVSAAALNSTVLQRADAPILARPVGSPSTEGSVAPILTPSPAAATPRSTAPAPRITAAAPTPKPLAPKPLAPKPLAPKQRQLLRVSALSGVSPQVVREVARGTVRIASEQDAGIRRAAELVGVPLTTLAQVEKVPEAGALGHGSDEIDDDGDSEHDDVESSKPSDQADGKPDKSKRN